MVMDEKEEFQKMIIVQAFIFIMVFCVLFGVLTLVRTAVVG
jgi:hypothetical protein